MRFAEAEEITAPSSVISAYLLMGDADADGALPVRRTDDHAPCDGSFGTAREQDRTLRFRQQRRYLRSRRIDGNEKRSVTVI